MDELIATLKGNETVKVKYFVASGHKWRFEASWFYSFQINLFEKMSSRIIAELGINPIRHILNTSG
jgi:alanine racemase